jgi:hypothetical protein
MSGVFINYTDSFLQGIDGHVKEIMSGEFKDVPDGDIVFKGIQDRGRDIVSDLVGLMFPEYEQTFNFVRKSPVNQEEPYVIHQDGMVGDIIVILYLNKVYPENAGTNIYENLDTGKTYCEDHSKVCDGKNFKISSTIKMKYNRLVAFPARLYHSRAIEDNFGNDKDGDSRVAQVLFLKLR